jgi:hypothetical protein
MFDKYQYASGERVMIKKVIIAILIIIAVVIGVGVWYYLRQAPYPQIEKILSNPKAYEGKVVTIEGEVTDRTSFFVVVKFINQMNLLFSKPRRL